MANLKTRHIFAKVHPHVLPHPRNNWQAFLLKSPSLFLYIVFLVSLTLVFNIISIVRPGILGYASNIQKDDIISLTNQKRAGNNIGNLSENHQLTQAAIGKAQNMFAENYWAHIAPSGKTPWDFIKGSGYNYTAAGENLARDFDESNSVVNAWMASSSHRENLLNGSYQEIGIGVVNGVLDGRETTLVVQMFGSPKSKSSLAKAPVPPAAAQVAQVQPTPTITKTTPSPTTTAKPTTTVTKTESTITPTENLVSPFKSSEVAAIQSTPTRTIVNSFQIVRSVSLSLLILLVILLGADLVFATRRHLVRATGHTVAHLGLLVLLLVAIWYTNSGLIL